ncbi:hypothetical protein ACFU6M_32265, partial [Streptomyces bottropensis]
VPREDFGFLGPLLALDQPASAAATRELLGWEPVGPGRVGPVVVGPVVVSPVSGPWTFRGAG